MKDRILSQAFEPGYDPYNSNSEWRAEICLKCVAESSVIPLYMAKWHPKPVDLTKAPP